MACQLGNIEWITMKISISTIRTGSSLLTQQGGWRHLSAGHTIDGIIDEDDGNMLTTVQGVDGFAGTDARQIAIALISEDETIRPQALDTRSYSRCTTMSSLLPVNIQIAISKDSAAHRTYAHRLILHAHLLDNLGNELMNYAMRTPRAIVHRGIVHQRRLLIYQILW